MARVTLQLATTTTSYHCRLCPNVFVASQTSRRTLCDTCRRYKQGRHHLKPVQGGKR